MLHVRRTGFGALALAATVVWFAMAPEDVEAPSTDGYRRAITQALEEAELNNESAQGAPQQQVVNGWTQRDLLSIVAAQNNDLLAAAAPSPPDPRIPALLTLLILGVVLLGLTTLAPRPTAGEGVSTAAARRHDAHGAAEHLANPTLHQPAGKPAGEEPGDEDAPFVGWTR